MAREKDHFGRSLRLEELIERLNLMFLQLQELEPQDQQNLAELKKLKELIELCELRGLQIKELLINEPEFSELSLVIRQVMHQIQKLELPDITKDEATIKVYLNLETELKCEKFATALGWFIPRKYRNVIIGDILEDCAEMRQTGCTESRIKVHVVYQWLIAVITLVPTAVKASIVDAVKQLISLPK